MGTACRPMKPVIPGLALSVPQCASSRLTVVDIVTSFGHGLSDRGLTFSLAPRETGTRVV